MAMTDEGMLQSNIYNILSTLRKMEACSCSSIVTAMWVKSSTSGVVFMTVTGNGSIAIYNQPGGIQITNYGTLTPL